MPNRCCACVTPCMRKSHPILTRALHLLCAYIPQNEMALCNSLSGVIMSEVLEWSHGVAFWSVFCNGIKLDFGCVFFAAHLFKNVN